MFGSSKLVFNTIFAFLDDKNLFLINLSVLSSTLYTTWHLFKTFPKPGSGILHWQLSSLKFPDQSFIKDVVHLVFTDCHGGEKNTASVSQRHLEFE